ncbi:hypothetical protein AUJ77_02995 [Candidatus Nomurabacteria bacterium CG1_02_43_90]|uniref:Bifunctional protein FolD n=1 Tax=Candidatus Nomurabacteria bacterium CG1_02_43_90 TaxID=1805281 RepID=A0A1J4V049_9BACT|nr:MAG: hypothetical protein AUJ77_02995 [Candidatus Nomurabacteria bacterium CG1_02_43_90]
MLIIDGKKITEGILSDLKKLPVPSGKLVVVLVGENPASRSFLRQKERVARDLGVSFELRSLPDSLSQEELERVVLLTSQDASVRGVIVQLPLPQKYNAREVIKHIDMQKDIDALREGNEGMLPPAVLSLAYILKEINFDLTHKQVVVVGHGFLIGQPIALWLKNKKCDVVVLDKDNFTPSVLKEADLIISGTGKVGLIRGEYLKEGVVVVDYGYGMQEGKVSGDVDIDSVQNTGGFATPTPGGTGPLVVVSLLVNFYGKQ